MRWKGDGKELEIIQCASSWVCNKLYRVEKFWLKGHTYDPGAKKKKKK